MSFTTTGHNSWFDHLQATTYRNNVTISCYGPHSIARGGVPITNHNSYSLHKMSTTLATTCDCTVRWRPSIRATTHTLTLVPLIRPQPWIATCVPSILNHNSRNLIPSHNSWNALARCILKVSPKFL